MNRKVKTILTLTALSATALHIINRIEDYVYSNKELLEIKKRQTYSWRFGDISYTKSGNGFPLLLIHNITPGSSSYEYSKIEESLSKDHTVYSVDLPGYGMSSKNNLTYDSFLLAQFMNDFIKHVIGKPTDVIASGDFAPIAILSMHNEPHTIRKLIMINPQSLYDQNQVPSKGTKFLKTIIELPILGTFIYNLYTSKMKMEEDFKKEYFFNADAVTNEILDAYLQSAHKDAYHAKYSFASHCCKYTNCNILHALKETNHSLYIIEGKAIPNSETTVENYLYYNPSMEAAYIDNCKQLALLEKPEELLKQINIFLA